MKFLFERSFDEVVMLTQCDVKVLFQSEEMA